MRWQTFRATQPVAAKYAKWVSWVSGVAISVWSAVSLSAELYRTFHGLNRTDSEIMARIENVTMQLKRLQNKSLAELIHQTDQTIFELYHQPLKRVKRGEYSLGIEDAPKPEDDQQTGKADLLYQNIPGIPALNEETFNATRVANSTKISHLEKGFDLVNFWEAKRLPPRMLGWIILAKMGFIICLVEACVLLSASLLPFHPFLTPAF